MQTKNRENFTLWYKPNKEGRNFNAILIVSMSPKIYLVQVVN